jgi:2-keto-3-deoxy-L-rhamnonate aldolase RhmA
MLYLALREPNTALSVRGDFHSPRDRVCTRQRERKLNEESLVVVHVEGQRGVENIAEIVSVPHIDVIFLGPYDLSQSLGIPGQVRDPRVIELMQQCVTIIRDSGKAVGTFADNPEVAKQWIDAGIQYIGLGVDVSIFLRACENLVNAVRT